SPSFFVGQKVRSLDRGNIGEIVAINGDYADVYFLNQETGKDATVPRPLSGLVALCDPGAGGDEWGPLRLGDAPPAEPFADVILPDPVYDFVRVVSASIGCPPDFVGLPVLVIAGAAIGRSASLLLKPGYFASASLYGMNVGGPSSGKSPALDAVVAPMWEIDR